MSDCSGILCIDSNVTSVIIGALISIFSTICFNMWSSRKKRNIVREALFIDIRNDQYELKNTLEKVENWKSTHDGKSMEKAFFPAVFGSLKFLKISSIYEQNKEIILEFNNSQYDDIFTYFGKLERLQIDYLNYNEILIKKAYLEITEVDKIWQDLNSIIDIGERINTTLHIHINRKWYAFFLDKFSRFK